MIGPSGHARNCQGCSGPPILWSRTPARNPLHINRLSSQPTLYLWIHSGGWSCRVPHRSVPFHCPEAGPGVSARHFFLPGGSDGFVASATAGIATRPGRPLPGQDSHLLDQRAFYSRRTWTSTPDYDLRLCHSLSASVCGPSPKAVRICSAAAARAPPTWGRAVCTRGPSPHSRPPPAAGWQTRLP